MGAHHHVCIRCTRLSTAFETPPCAGDAIAKQEADLLHAKYTVFVLSWKPPTVCQQFIDGCSLIFGSCRSMQRLYWRVSPPAQRLIDESQDKLGQFWRQPGQEASVASSPNFQGRLPRMNPTLIHQAGCMPKSRKADTCRYEGPVPEERSRSPELSTYAWALEAASYSRFWLAAISARMAAIEEAWNSAPGLCNGVSRARSPTHSVGIGKREEQLPAVMLFCFTEQLKRNNKPVLLGLEQRFQQ